MECSFVRPEAIHEPLAYYQDAEYEQVTAICRVFKEGVSAFRQQCWDEAERCFREAVRVHPGDGPSKVYLDRCADYRQSPPGSDWDGVWTMTEK